MSELTEGKSKRWIECRALVTDGLRDFYRVGEALREIRDSKLYLVEYGTFEECCKDLWGRTQRWAYQEIDYSTAENIVKTHMLKWGTLVKRASQDCPIFTSKRQIQPLLKAPADKWGKIVDRATESSGGKLTEKAIRKAVKEELAISAPTPAKTPALKNDELRPHVREALDKSSEFRALQREITAIVKKCEALSERPYGVILLHHLTEIKAHLRNSWSVLKFSAPYADCVVCAQRGCEQCKNAGFLGRDTFNAVPEAMRKRSKVIHEAS
jgi:hypothetical protein